MRSFEYATVTDLQETGRLLAHGDGTLRMLAGGTDLLPLMKADVAQPEQLVDLKRLPELATGIQETSEGVAIGALTTLAQIESSPRLRSSYAALAQAAGLAATPQLRNMATLGGNLLQRPRCWYFRSAQFQCWLKGGQTCHAREGENQFHAIFDQSPCVAVHPSDPPAALLALDAQLSLWSDGTTRTLPLADFFTLPTDQQRTENTLQAHELIVAIHLPSANGLRSTYVKAMNRKVWAFALVGVAAAVRLEGGRVSEARLVLNGVAPIPWRITAAEQQLVGQPLDSSSIDQAVDVALQDAQPLQHNGYKLTLARGLIRQALASLA